MGWVPFEEKPDVREQLGKLRTRWATIKRGERITFDEFAAVCGVDYHTGRGRYLLKKLRDVLLKRLKDGIVLLPLRGVGFVVATHTEQAIGQIHTRAGRASRQVRRAQNEAMATASSGLSAHEVGVRAMLCQSLEDQRRELRAAVRQSSIYAPRKAERPKLKKLA